MRPLAHSNNIEKMIYCIRGHRVMLDNDLAKLYGVATKNLNKAVKRNINRFPPDFMLRLTVEEYKALRFQFGTLKRGRHAKYLPHVFTQEGVAMLSGVLRSSRAVKVNIEIMRAFVKLRGLVATQRELTKKIGELERKVETHDVRIHEIFDAIRSLMNIPEEPKRSIGFR